MWLVSKIYNSKQVELIGMTSKASARKGWSLTQYKPSTVRKSQDGCKCLPRILERTRRLHKAGKQDVRGVRDPMVHICHHTSFKLHLPYLTMCEQWSREEPFKLPLPYISCELG